MSVKFSPVPQSLKALGPDASQWLQKLKDKMAAPQTDTTAADLAALKVDFNALLAKLRAAGLMES